MVSIPDFYQALFIWSLMTRGPLPVSVPSGCSYEILTPNAIPKGFMDGKQACEKMVCRGKGLLSGWGLWLGMGPADGGSANCMHGQGLWC